MNSPEKQSSYALRDKVTGRLVRFLAQDNPGGYASLGEAVTLCYQPDRDSPLPVYEQPTLRQLARALEEDTPSYNATYSTPRHGDVRVEDLEFVKRTVTEELLPMEWTPSPPLRPRLKADKPIFVLRRYAKQPSLDASLRTMMLFELPQGETVDSMKSKAAREVFSTTSYVDVQLMAVFEVPEDYAGDLDGKPGFGAVVREVAPDFVIPEAAAPALYLYEEGCAVPVPAIWPLDETLWRPHVDGADLVTFAATVPLVTLLDGRESLGEYFAEAFGTGITVENATFTPLAIDYETGAAPDETGGDVTIQVVCQLTTAG